MALPDRLYLVGKDGKITYAGGRGPRGFKPDELEDAIREELAKLKKANKTQGKDQQNEQGKDKQDAQGKDQQDAQGRDGRTP